MKSISASLVILSGTILIAASGFQDDRDVRASYLLYGIALSVTGLSVWIWNLNREK